MTRLVLVLVAAALGTGCGMDDDDRRVGEASFSWQFRDFDGNVAGAFTAADEGCGEAGVTDVDIEVFRGQTRVFFSTFPCVDAQTGHPGGRVVRMSSGSHTYRLTGYRLNDPVFEAVGALDVPVAAAADILATLDVLTPAPLTLYYTQNGTFSCSGTPWVYYAVYTSPTKAILVESDTLACDSFAFGFSLIPDLAVGTNFYVDFMQLLDGGLVSRFERCGATVRHGGFPVYVDLAPAPGGGCP